MSRKKYTDRTKTIRRTLYSDDWHKDCGFEITIIVEHVFGRVSYLNIHKLDWGSAAQEWYGHDLWVNLVVDDRLELQKLTSKLQAHTPEEFVDRIKDRFGAYGSSSFDHIHKFLKAKGIECRRIVQ